MNEPTFEDIANKSRRSYRCNHCVDNGLLCRKHGKEDQVSRAKVYMLSSNEPPSRYTCGTCSDQGLTCVYNDAEIYHLGELVKFYVELGNGQPQTGKELDASSAQPMPAALASRTLPIAGLQEDPLVMPTRPDGSTGPLLSDTPSLSPEADGPWWAEPDYFLRFQARHSTVQGVFREKAIREIQSCHRASSLYFAGVAFESSLVLLSEIRRLSKEEEEAVGHSMVDAYRVFPKEHHPHLSPTAALSTWILGYPPDVRHQTLRRSIDICCETTLSERDAMWYRLGQIAKGYYNASRFLQAGELDKQLTALESAECAIRRLPPDVDKVSLRAFFLQLGNQHPDETFWDLVGFMTPI